MAFIEGCPHVRGGVPLYATKYYAYSPMSLIFFDEHHIASFHITTRRKCLKLDSVGEKKSYNK